MFVKSAQRALDNEKQRWKNVGSYRRKLLNKCKQLQDQLHEWGVNKFLQDDNCTVDSSSLGDALDLLTTSDDTISALGPQVLICFWFFFLFIVNIYGFLYKLVPVHTGIFCI